MKNREYLNNNEQNTVNIITSKQIIPPLDSLSTLGLHGPSLCFLTHHWCLFLSPLPVPPLSQIYHVCVTWFSPWALLPSNHTHSLSALIQSLGCKYQSPTDSSEGFPGGSDPKESACNAGDLGSLPEQGSSSERGHGNPLQYSCLENSMDRGAWWATLHGVVKGQTQLSD